jgi:4-amino-4-deoxy-L-arabinose transferase-like glycosyltransferase
VRDIRDRIGTPNFFFIFVCVWCAVVLFSGLHLGDLSGYDDAAYAHQARAMLASGDWWTVSYNGLPDFDKPPLFVWMVAISFKLFGITDAAAKVPAAISGVATVITTYFLAKELFPSDLKDEPRQWVPALAAMCIATTQYFLKYSTHAMTDVPFTFFFTLSIYFYVRSWKSDYYLLLAGAAIGLATLIRSPLGLIPLAIILVHIVLQKRFRMIGRPPFLLAAFISLAIPAAWYLHEFMVFGNEFVVQHFAFLSEHSASAETAGGALRYFDYLALIFRQYIPWWITAAYGIYLTIRTRYEQSAAQLLLIWTLLVLVPLSIADSKVLRYIMPAFPAFAIFSAIALCRVMAPSRARIFAQVSTALLAAALVVLIAFPNYEIRAEDMRTLAPISDRATPEDQRVIIFTGGTFKWNYQTQLLWYGHRNCTHLKEIGDVQKLIDSTAGQVIIMDIATFNELIDRTQVTVLGRSNDFVCLRTNAPTPGR